MQHENLRRVQNNLHSVEPARGVKRRTNLATAFECHGIGNTASNDGMQRFSGVDGQFYPLDNRTKRYTMVPNRVPVFTLQVLVNPSHNHETRTIYRTV